jgi:lysophospholipase L1-like esterase
MINMKILIIIIAILLAVPICLELGLRLLLGLGNPPLYMADDEIGYLLRPSQRVRRFGNQIIINEYSQRNNFMPNRDNAEMIILCLGDSIINGGWWTGQDKTIPALMEVELSVNHQVRVLNASANSWGPRNQLAYLRKFGVFEAKMLVLVLNTDDLFAIAPNSLPVGYDRNYPDQKPPLALIELINYLKPKPPHPQQNKVNAEKGDRVGFNLAAIQQIKAIALANNSQLILAMTPLLREVQAPGSRDYEQKARQRLKEFTQQEQIPYLDFLSTFANTSQPETLYRDHIHLSPTGNQLVSQQISDFLKQKLP